MRLVLLNLCILIAINIKGQHSIVENSGDILQFALPGAAFASTFIWQEDDCKGSWEFIKTAALSTVVTYSIKYAVNKPRPDGSDYAFPSGHTSRAFTGAAFIQRKYGWKLGAPAYLLASFTGWTRVYSEKHDYWDIAGGAAVGVISAYIFAKPYQSNNAQLGFSMQKKQYHLSFNYTF